MASSAPKAASRRVIHAAIALLGGVHPGPLFWSSVSRLQALSASRPGLVRDLPVDQRDAIRMITTHLHDIPEMRCALGRVSDQKPMVTQRRQAFIPGIRNVCIPRAAQMSEHRGAQS